MCIYTLTDEVTRPDSLFDGDFTLETTEHDDIETEEDLR